MLIVAKCFFALYILKRVLVAKYYKLLKESELFFKFIALFHFRFGFKSSRFVAFDYLKLIQYQSLQQQVCIFAAHEKVTQVQHFRNKTDHWEAMTASTGS